MKNVNPSTRSGQASNGNLKILFIITQSEMGGAQRFVLDTSFWLSQNNYDVVVAAGGNGLNEKIKMKNEKPQSKIKNFRLKYLKRTPNPLGALFAIKEIYNLLKEERPDVLFLCSTMAGLLGSIASRIYAKSRIDTNIGTNITNKKMGVIYRIGGWAFNDPRPWWQKKIIIFLERFTAKFKDKIIVNSEFDLQSALKHKIAPADKLTKIYNGINPEEIDFLPKEQAKKYLSEINNLTIKQFNPEGHFDKLSAYGASNSVIIGTIANFYKTKGLACLINAFHLLQASNQNYKLLTTPYQLVIIGDGKERKNLEKLIVKYKLQDTVFLAGRISDARKYLKAFDIFVLPSLKEGFPWALLEAMAAAVPVIATRVGAIPEVIQDAKNGLLIPPGNAEILAKKIQGLLTNPALGSALANNAKETITNFSQDKMLKAIETEINISEDRPPNP